MCRNGVSVGVQVVFFSTPITARVTPVSDRIGQINLDPDVSVTLIEIIDEMVIPAPKNNSPTVRKNYLGAFASDKRIAAVRSTNVVIFIIADYVLNRVQFIFKYRTRSAPKHSSDIKVESKAG